MKLFASILFVAAFAVVTPGYAQMGGNPGGPAPANNSTDDVVSSISGIHRPTPKPGTTSTAKATGPMDAGLFKDAKGKSAATAYGVNDTVYLVCTNVSASKGDKLAATWYEDKGGKSKKLTATPTAVPDTGVYNPSYNLPPAKGGSPVGAYHVELSQNSKVLKSLKFTVK